MFTTVRHYKVHMFGWRGCVEVTEEGIVCVAAVHLTAWLCLLQWFTHKNMKSQILTWCTVIAQFFNSLMPWCDIKCIYNLLNSPHLLLRRQFPLSPKCLYGWVRVYTQVCTFSHQVRNSVRISMESGVPFFQATFDVYAMVINETSAVVLWKFY